MSFEQIDASGAEAWLAGLREDLVSKTYRPDPVRRVDDPEAWRRRTSARHPDHSGSGGSDRRQPPGCDPGAIFEADFEDSAYGYRPRRSAVDAVKETHRLLCRGYTDVVDADLSKYLDAASYCPQVYSMPPKRLG